MSMLWPMIYGNYSKTKQHWNWVNPLNATSECTAHAERGHYMCLPVDCVHTHHSHIVPLLPEVGKCQGSTTLTHSAICICMNFTMHHQTSCTSLINKQQLKPSQGHMRDSLVSTPVVGLVPDAILHKAVRASFRKATSVQSLPVILMFLSCARVTCMHLQCVKLCHDAIKV